MIENKAAAETLAGLKPRDGTSALPLVEMRGITKKFSGVTANRDVDFSVDAGEVHALLGENGAGKSTLMNVLYGLYMPDRGRIFVDGHERAFSSPKDAIASGIGMVHQHFMLVQTHTVWENMILGVKEMPFLLPRKKIQDRIAQISEQYGLEIDPTAAVWQLSTGEQQRVALLQMLYRDARVLILDEPTAVLTPQEADRLFLTIRRMTREGHGVVFISHKLKEVMSETNRVTVLRGGENAGTVATAMTTEEALAEMMVGRKTALGFERRPTARGDTVLEADDIHVLGDRGIEAVSGLSLSLRGGEILGVAGVAGNGQRELCEALAGLRPLIKGRIVVNGKRMDGAPPRRFIDELVHYIPSDRKGTGMAPGMDIVNNAILKKYWSKPVARGAFIDWGSSADYAEEIVRKFGVSVSSLSTPVKNLSGGNLQKLLMGRELSGSPRAVIVMHPTWGLDVSATRYVRDQLLARREGGSAILLISEDLDELLALSDRLAVIFKGKFMGVTDDPRSLPIEDIGLMMAGGRGKSRAGAARETGKNGRSRRAGRSGKAGKEASS
ncbi:MAG: ABC transporter ATP-binding protein [Synergistaceae bacterium]|jgi:simple sugar transport system ATP-binding protein|nr:ABC transporter ATP-binding protein [Synergistaceae bacterium]